MYTSSILINVCMLLLELIEFKLIYPSYIDNRICNPNIIRITNHRNRTN